MIGSDPGGTEARPRASSKGLGAVAGGTVALAFTFLHDLLIDDIWFNVVPMLLAGALCGLCLVWSFSTTPGSRSATRWLAFTGVHVGLLLLLAGASLVVLDPIVSMAEIMASSDPLGEVIPPAMPLMIWASALGTGVVWILFGRRPASLLPMFLTQALLVFLIGHNLAILGLVDVPADSRFELVEFFGLTVFLGAGFAIAFVALDGGIDRVRRARARGVA